MPDDTEQEFAASRQSRRLAFRFVCRALSRQPTEPLLTPKEAEEIDWLCVAEQINREQVVTNLFAAFQERGWPAWLPDDFRNYLASIHEANRIQNERIRALVLALGDILGAAEIPFVLLKGANWLMEAGNQIGDRQLTDIDLLVTPDNYERAIGALGAAGFRAAAPAETYARHFHHVPLARPDDPVTIELHRHLGWQRHLLTPGEVIAAAEPIADAPAVGTMSPMHRFVFGCLHAQLQNMGYGSGVFSLRDLTDIRYLLEHKADRLDWPAIVALGRERGIYRYLALPLHLTRQLLGTELPEPFAHSRLGHFNALRCVTQRRLDPGQKFGRLAVKVAWVMDARRHSYERDCEEAVWPLRQAAIARGRFQAFLAAASGRKRVTKFAAPEDASDS